MECFQCGACTATCPIGYMGEEPIDARNMIRRAQIGLEITQNIWNCSTCRLCEESCPRGVKIVNVILGLRQLEFEERKAPEKVEKIVWDIYENGNPWGGKKTDRAKWAEGMDIKDAREGVDVLLYVGCDAAYNKDLHRSLKSLANIMKKAGINFGILGNDERCCGEPVRNAGENGYLEELVNDNIKEFEKTGAKKIVAFSPHCGNMFLSTYKKMGLNIEVEHYSEFINELINEGRIKLNEEARGKITIHDPCYLSRYGDGYKDIRETLSFLPKVEIDEMEDSGKGSICCGGGGNRMFMDFEGKRLSDFRIIQARDTGADTVLTACPICNMNLNDSSKVNSAGINVKELSEYLEERMK